MRSTAYGAGEPRVLRRSDPLDDDAAGKRRVGAARGAHAVLVSLAVLGCLHALFLLGVEAWRWRVTASAVHRLEGSVQALENEAADLSAVVDHAGDDRYREDLARLQGYMYPNEERAVTQQDASSADPPPTP